VVDPFVARRADVHLRAEGPLVLRALGALVDQRTLLARERRRLVVALDEVLPDLRPDELEQEAQVPDDRVVAQHRVLRLPRVVDAEPDQQREQQHGHRADVEGHPHEGAQQKADAADQPHQVADRKLFVELGEPGRHGRSSMESVRDGSRPATRRGRYPQRRRQRRATHGPCARYTRPQR
jgi:hypothetical protein